MTTISKCTEWRNLLPPPAKGWGILTPGADVSSKTFLSALSLFKQRQDPEAFYRAFNTRLHQVHLDRSLCSLHLFKALLEGEGIPVDLINQCIDVACNHVILTRTAALQYKTECAVSRVLRVVDVEEVQKTIASQIQELIQAYVNPSEAKKSEIAQRVTARFFEVHRKEWQSCYDTFANPDLLVQHAHSLDQACLENLKTEKSKCQQKRQDIEMEFSAAKQQELIQNYERESKQEEMMRQHSSAAKFLTRKEAAKKDLDQFNEKKQAQLDEVDRRESLLKQFEQMPAERAFYLQKLVTHIRRAYEAFAPHLKRLVPVDVERVDKVLARPCTVEATPSTSLSSRSVLLAGLWLTLISLLVCRWQIQE